MYFSWHYKEKEINGLTFQSVNLFFFCRNEATRTPDPYVPNVVRYQLRYIPPLKVVSPGIEPGTQGFSVLCSTN